MSGYIYLVENLGNFEVKTESSDWLVSYFCQDLKSIETFIIAHFKHRFTLIGGMESTFSADRVEIVKAFLELLDIQNAVLFARELPLEPLQPDNWLSYAYRESLNVGLCLGLVFSLFGILRYE